jgi:hypothetical protein
MPAMAMVTTENAGRIERLLAAARETIAQVRFARMPARRVTTNGPGVS